MYRNPVRGAKPETGSDWKKVVPKSGTQGRSGKRQRSEEKCTGIRYAKRIREEVAIERKLYRNPENCDWKRNVPKFGTSRKIRNKQRQRLEECTGIRYTQENSEWNGEHRSIGRKECKVKYKYATIIIIELSSQKKFKTVENFIVIEKRELL